MNERKNLILLIILFLSSLNALHSTQRIQPLHLSVMAAQPPFQFEVRRRQPELIRPAKPTPHEFKKLSDIDDQQGLRTQVPLIIFFNGSSTPMKKKKRDPVQAVREGISKALVYFYPFAGRLMELPEEGRKLVVECSGEGVLFIEADADVRLDQFGDDELRPPFPCLKDLLHDVPGSAGIVNAPLLLIQVTRLNCGGFIVAIRLNHTVSDGAGLALFMRAAGEMARGATAPSVLPIWERHLLSARVPPRVTCTHREYDQLAAEPVTGDMVHRSFFFGPSQITAVRNHLPSYSTFEALTALLWRCRTAALRPNPKAEVRVIFTVNARTGRLFSPPLPEGYYGNAIAYPVAITTAAELCNNPLGFAAELVRKAKASVTEEYMRSVADLMVLRGRPAFTLVGSYLVSDARGRLREVDFGWGKGVFAGPALGTVASFQIYYKNRKGEEGVLVPMNLPADAMERFVYALNSELAPAKKPLSSL